MPVNHFPAKVYGDAIRLGGWAEPYSLFHRPRRTGYVRIILCQGLARHTRFDTFTPRVNSFAGHRLFPVDYPAEVHRGASEYLDGL